MKAATKGLEITISVRRKLKNKIKNKKNKKKETNRKERTIYRAMSAVYEVTLLIGNKANQCAPRVT